MSVGQLRRRERLTVEHEGETAEDALARLLAAVPMRSSKHCQVCGTELDPLDETDWLAWRLRVKDSDRRRTDLFCGPSCLADSMNARLEVPITEAPE